MGRFIDEPVTVEFDHATAQPAALIWRGERLRVREVLSDARVVDLEHRWWQRRHRRKLVVRVEDGRFFEIWGRRPGVWVLYREVDEPWG
ncbi:MAG: DUF6504 family protein [Firmicutes bacterium]|nr:hypothetical protein [Alicyclobacillaceae bacterium]MCL6497755.1 DUF6504 family protein [Bacillota bacterium]